MFKSDCCNKLDWYALMDIGFYELMNKEGESSKTKKCRKREVWFFRRGTKLPLNPVGVC